MEQQPSHKMQSIMSQFVILPTVSNYMKWYRQSCISMCKTTRFSRHISPNYMSHVWSFRLPSFGDFRLGLDLSN